MTDFTPSSQWFVKEARCRQWRALYERLRHVSRWHIMTRNHRRFSLPQKPLWQHENSLSIKNRKWRKNYLTSTTAVHCYLLIKDKEKHFPHPKLRTLTPQNINDNNKSHNFDNSVHKHLLSKPQTLTPAKSCMLGAHETYGFHEPLHRKVQLWKMSVEVGKKALFQALGS